jgi:copper homeostasis protein
MRIIEICAGDIQSAQAAVQGGAQRIELCSALPLDGLTPSAGLIKAARSLEGIKLHVLIRPREGDFVYDATETDIMLHDISLAKQFGADGVVIGALTPDGDIDIPTCRRLIEATEGMQVTFHRAYDRARNPHRALEEIIALGCTRLLTSGQAPTAEAGIPLLRELVHQANGRIIIMPGAGVNPANARHILDATGANEIHGSFRSLHNGRLITDAQLVRKVITALNRPH